jgi:DNA polymerase I-like protein with 3'-5' exonuclease and polymerase domains
VRLARAMKDAGLQAYICLNVHDEICVRCPESEVTKVCALMKPIMETTITLDAPLTADPQVGYTYGEVK